MPNLTHRKVPTLESCVSKEHKITKFIIFTEWKSSKADFLNAIFDSNAELFWNYYYKIWNCVKVLVKILTHIKNFQQKISLFVSFWILNLTQCKFFSSKSCVSNKRVKWKNCRSLGVTWFILCFLNATFFFKF